MGEGAEMLVEKLSIGDDEITLGLTEAVNSKGLTKDQLLSLASDSVDDFLALQFFRADVTSGAGHVLSAAQNAVNAWQGGYGKTRSLSMEFLVYSSAQRQIGRALEEMGVRDGMESVAIAVIGKDQSDIESCLKNLIEAIGTEADPMFEASAERLQKVMTHFDIKIKEIEALTSSAKLEEKMSALTRCVASRVSLVAFES